MAFGNGGPRIVGRGPAVRQTHHAELARVAVHHERPLDIVEQAHAFGIERMRAHEVLAGQQGEAAAARGDTR